MHDRSESGTSMENPVSNEEQPFGGDPRLGDIRDHPAQYDWMTGGGRGRRRAMMMSMMMDPMGFPYGMDGGGFGFGGRGGGRGGRGGWFGFGGRGRGNGRRDRHRRGWRYEVDDDEERLKSMAEQMDECHLYERCDGDGCGPSESSSSSSSSESDDEQNAPNDDVQAQQAHGGEVHGREGQSTDPAQQETTKSKTTEQDEDQPSSGRGCNRGNRRCRHGRGHHKHRHGKHKYRCHPGYHHFMIPPPHLHGFHRPPFPPMHLPHHCFPDFYDDSDMARKFFKRSMKQWYKAQKRAWKQHQGSHWCHRRVQRSDGDEATSGCDNEDDFEHPETQCQLPPPWLYYSYDHDGCGQGRRGVDRHGKKGKKHGKRRRQCNYGRPWPEEATTVTAQKATKDQAGAVDEGEKANEVREDGQAPMEEAAE